jgi:hypothetical protein
MLKPKALVRSHNTFTELSVVQGVILTVNKPPQTPDTGDLGCSVHRAGLEQQSNVTSRCETPAICSGEQLTSANPAAPHHSETRFRRWLRWAVGRHFRIQSFKVNMNGVKVGNAVLDGEVVGSQWKMALEARGLNGLDKLFRPTLSTETCTQT